MRTIASLPCVALAVFALGAGCRDTELTCQDIGTCPIDGYPIGPPAAGAGGESGAAGSSGAGGSGGAGGSLPCDGACDGETPVCEDSTQTCVGCTEPSHCSGATPRCDDGSNTCVECLESAHCSSPTNSRCDGGTCQACVTNEDCAHLAGAGVCDGGTCVQCTAADESACGANSCNPATKQCTSTPRGSLDSCMACVADSECIGGDQPDPERRCVPMQFAGQARAGGFCLKRVEKDCARPYMLAFEAGSLSGAVVERYCGIDQENVRCEALRDFFASATCEIDTDCGCGARDQQGRCVQPGSGGLCRPSSVGPNRCTYTCGSADDCFSGRSCVAGGFCQ